MVRKDRKTGKVPAGYVGNRWNGMRKCPRYDKCGKMYDYRNEVPHYNDLGFCSEECREKYIKVNTVFKVEDKHYKKNLRRFRE
jgi:hypothetical protein